MTVPARAEATPMTGAALDAARADLVPRIRRGDLAAFGEFLELTGGTVTGVEWSEPPS